MFCWGTLFDCWFTVFDCVVLTLLFCVVLFDCAGIVIEGMLKGAEVEKGSTFGTKEEKGVSQGVCSGSEGVGPETSQDGGAAAVVVPSRVPGRKGTVLVSRCSAKET